MESFDVTLASNLLDLKLEQHEKKNSSKISLPPTDELKTGVNSIDQSIPHQTWRSGRTLGIASITSSTPSDNEDATNLISELLATHLFSHGHSSGAPDQRTPSVFLLTPPSSKTIAVVYDKLVQRFRATKGQSQREKNHTVDAIVGNDTGNDTSSEQVLSLLNEISVLQYLDLIGLSESISEVSSHLSSSSSSSSLSMSVSTILYIEGLSAVLSRTTQLSTSKTSQIAALTTNILRSIRILARNRPGLLVLLDLQAGVSTVVTNTRQGQGQGQGHGVLHTAFGNAVGSNSNSKLTLTLTLDPVSDHGKEFRDRDYTRESPFNSVACADLGRIVEGFVDAVVVVHDGFRSVGDEAETRLVVEVVKDSFQNAAFAGSGTRTALGSWAVWEN